MQKLIWEDATSYSRDDRERTPRAWRVKVGDLSIWVGSDHLYYKGQWVVSCDPWFQARQLGDNIKTAEEAQNRALALVRSRVRRLAIDFGVIEATETV